MMIFLTILALTGAACSANNYRHARDSRSPEHPGRAVVYQLLLMAFGAVVIWAAAMVLKGSYEMTAGRWVVYCATFCATAAAVVRTAVNDVALRHRVASAQRYRVIPFNRALWLCALLLPLFGGGGCAGGTGATVRVDAVDGSFRRVADRHDKYVTADPALSDLERRIALRDTALLRGALDEAKKVPATQPAAGK